MSGTPDRPIEHSFQYANTFARETLHEGTVRLKVGLRGGQNAVLRVLGAVLAPPYRLLYLLHTSLVGSPLGRYESPDLDGPDIERFSDQFGRYISEDARHDVWLHSMTDEGTVVIDRYNMVYVYGPLEQAEQLLRKGGVQEVASWAPPEVPYPHALHYHPEFNAHEQDILAAFEWRLTRLATDDVQFWSGPQAS